MKKQVLYLLGVIAVMISSSFSPGPPSENLKGIAKTIEMVSVAGRSSSTGMAKKYGIKSGIITFETTMEMSRMKIPGKKMVFFDDYGMKECEETYEGDHLKESFVSDGKERFKLFHANKTVYKVGTASNGIAMPFNWDEVSQKDKDAGIAKQGGKVTVAGKDCETFTYVTETAGTATTTKYAGWNHILLSMELSTAEMKSSQIVVKFEENAVVAAEKFRAPAGYKVL